jgi:hypothetical protein
VGWIHLRGAVAETAEYGCVVNTITATEILDYQTTGGETMKLGSMCATLAAGVMLVYVIAIILSMRLPGDDFDRIRASCNRAGLTAVDILDRDGDIIAIRCDRRDEP